MSDVQGAEEGALKRGANEVRTTFDNLQSDLKRVDEAVGNITKIWGGSAHNAFAGLLAAWNQDVTALNKILLDLEDALGGAESDRVAMESEARDTITGLQSMMA